MKTLKRLLIWGSIFVLLAIACLLVGAGYWSYRMAVPMDEPIVDYIVDQGSTPRQIAQAMDQAGVHVQPNLFVILARLSGRDVLLKAGAYEAVRGDTPWRLIERMANGDMTQVRLTFPEGWTYGQMREALSKRDDVRQTLDGVSDQEILSRLGIEQSAPEGLFYPDTYVFSPGTTDFDILRRAAKGGAQILDEIWANREPDLPLRTPYEALVLASIIEKETGHGDDRGRVAGVFINRLRIGMPLQTDPTVIYGMGAAYQGRLRKKDLETDTPWNTYTRAGLPPTPIANPGKASLWAAVHPERHDYLYFVSRGDGRSEFSSNLAAHNRAVKKFILQRK
ncbi:endolytic transglycosylase MltG [Alcaligenaceae bacterium CGII-47]|nr:endolytic transglycosylase MltG [Alcaligenaceae bacterium CGII-47]